MALRAAHPLLPSWYEPKGHEGEGVRFKLKGLNPAGLFDVNAHSISDGKNVKFPATAIRSALAVGLLGWEGFLEESGAAVPFSSDVDASMERLGFGLSAELFGEIVAMSNLSGEQAKN